MKKGSKKKNKKGKKSQDLTYDNTVSDKKLVTYLKTWKNNRDEWKFEKVKQIRLVSGMLDSEKVPEDVFPIFMEYMESSKGKIKETAINKATEIVEEMDKWSSLTDDEKEKVTEKPDVNRYNRARTILQTLL